MTYRELIDLYKEGKLDETQRERVKNDIERQEVISEYLFERDDVFGTEHFEEECVPVNISEEEQFTKMMKTAIRKAFVKMGIVVGAVVLVIGFLFVFAVPKIVNLFYYNPGEIVGARGGFETNRMSLDFAIYSELFLPESFRDTVYVEEEGYGKYSINVIQNTSYTKLFTNVAGKVERNKLTLYDSNLLSEPTGNAFVRDIPGVEDYYVGVGPAGEADDAMKALQELNDQECYVAYVTLSEVMTYSEFVEWCEKEDSAIYPSWCAIAQKTNEGYMCDENIGFNYGGGYSAMYHEGKYSYLTQWDVGQTTAEENDWVASEEVTTQHVISMLRYMSEQETFNKMMECETDYSYIADSVEEQGLHIYGFVMIGKKKDILETSNDENVAYIYTKPMR